jgi:hypothetical protein
MGDVPAPCAVRCVHVDAFSARPHGGNPAVVCLLPPGLHPLLVTPERLQAVANEMNVSETAFVTPVEEHGGGGGGGGESGARSETEVHTWLTSHAYRRVCVCVCVFVGSATLWLTVSCVGGVTWRRGQGQAPQCVAPVRMLSCAAHVARHYERGRGPAARELRCERTSLCVGGGEEGGFVTLCYASGLLPFGAAVPCVPSGLPCRAPCAQAGVLQPSSAVSGGDVVDPFQVCKVPAAPLALARLRTPHPAPRTHRRQP